MSETASPVLTPEMTMDLEVSGSAFGDFLPFLNPGLPQSSPWELIQMPPLVTSAIAPCNPLVLSPFPTMPVVAGTAGHGPCDPGPCKVIIQVSSEVKIVESAQNQSVTQTQAPPNQGATEAPSGHPAPLDLASSVPKTVTSTPDTTVTQSGMGDHLPHAPPPEAQIVPTIFLSCGGIPPQWFCGDSDPVPAWSQAPPEDSCRPSSVYENFQRWKLLKALTRRYLPRTPDTEVLSCFLIPVLRTLARLKPTMSLEEGLRLALREWRDTSNFDRMIYYDMAAKFKEFEEEEMEVQKPNGVQGLPPPTPPRPELQEAPGPPPAQQPACVPNTDSLCPQEAHLETHKTQQSPQTEAALEIPPEAVQEYMDIMDELMKVPDTVWGAPQDQRAAGSKDQQEEAGTCSEQEFLSYMNELCSQEAFVTKAEAIIHPSFLEHLVCPESQVDFVDLFEELEKEEELTPTQIVEKRLQASQDEEVMKARPQQQLTLKDSCPTETDSGHASRPGWAEATVMAPGASAPSLGSLESPPLQAGPATCPSLTAPTLDSRASRMLGEAPPGQGSPGPGEGSSEEEEDVTNLAFFVTPHYSLLPWGLATSPGPDTGPDTDPHLPGRQGDPELPCTRTRAFESRAPSRKRPLCGGPRRGNAEKTPCPRGHTRVSRGSALTVELEGPSLPPKRRFQPAVAQKRRRGHKRRFKEIEDQEGVMKALPQQQLTLKDSCPPETDSGHASRPGRAEATVMAPGASAPSLGSLESLPLQAGPATCPSLTAPTLDSRASRMLGEAPPGQGSPGPGEGSSEEEEDLTNLAFFVTPHYSLLPCGLLTSPGPDTGPDTGPHLPGHQGDPDRPSTHTRALDSKAPTRKHPLCGGPRQGTAEKTPCPRGHPRVSRGSALTLELEGPSLPPKRRFQPAMAQRRGRGHKRH